MKNLFIAALVILVTTMLSGCLGGGGGEGASSSSAGGFDSYASSGSQGVDLSLGSSISIGEDGTGGSEGGDIGATTHNPEPATMVLFGTGLLGMAIAKRKKRLH